MNKQPFDLFSDQASHMVNYELTSGELKKLLKLAGKSFAIIDMNQKNETCTIRGKSAVLTKYFDSKGKFIGEGKTADNKNETWASRLGGLIRSSFLSAGWLGAFAIYELVQDPTLRSVLIIVFVVFYLGVAFLPYLIEKFVNSVQSALPDNLAMGRMNLDNGNYKLAADNFWRALDTDPCNAEIWYLLGLAKDNNGQLDEALQHYERAISEKHDHPNAWNNKGIILRKLGKRKDAIACFKTAIDQGSEEAKRNLKILGK